MSQVRPLYRERVKDEVYIATGVRAVLFHHGHDHHELHHGHNHQELLHDGQVGGGLLLLVIVVSLGLVSLYRRKFLEGKASNDDDGDRDDHNKEVDDIDIKDNDDDFYKKNRTRQHSGTTVWTWDPVSPTIPQRCF